MVPLGPTLLPFGAGLRVGIQRRVAFPVLPAPQRRSPPPPSVLPSSVPPVWAPGP